ncbi:MAG TPA: SDR family oxidoreductase [Ktedonobacteraceae bacterium]|nr:SDR family oxidoreductase [Ktedonobacteraceae bacterium]
MPTWYDLDAQVVLIAGASSGMGKATALAAGAAGARLVLAARNGEALEEVRSSIGGGSVIIVPTNLTDRQAVSRLVDAAINEYGRIDAVVNSVGTNIRRRALDELTPESWSDMLASNLNAAFNLTQAIVPVFRRQGGGLLIHISSSAARKPDRSGVAYQASKAGVVGLAHGTMEEEREHGIRTTVIFPGLTDTPLVLKRPTPTPPEVLARALQPEDVAAACLFVMTLPPRAHVPELVLYPSRLDGSANSSATPKPYRRQGSRGK